MGFMYLVMCSNPVGEIQLRADAVAKELIYYTEKTKDSELGNLFDSIANVSNRQETLLHLLIYN
jgi:hypothetical protein